MSLITAHSSPFSGQWYPEEPDRLESLVDACLEESGRRADPGGTEDLFAFVVPHAGIVYSGTVAAAAYRHLARRSPARIFLIGFPHHGAPPGVWIPELAAYETPLGTTLVDRAAVAQLAGGKEFKLVPESRVCDHSVEIQLPFLRRVAPDAHLIPICVSGVEPGLRAAAANRLAGLIRPGDVLIASSDFTHYGRAFGFQPFPVDSATPRLLQSLDYDVIEAAASLDSSVFYESLRRTEATVCGREPIALLLETLAALQGEDEIFQERLDYQTSGEIGGDYSHSVSYAALGYYWHSSVVLSEEEQTLLLRSARQTLESYQRTGERVRIAPERLTPGLQRRAGIFVSLHQGRELRGCVGRTSPDDTIADSVPEMTLAAATEDTRFRPVASGESGIEIEISVLSPMKRIASQAGIVAGTHGAFVDAGWKRGLLLPQVASDRGWNTEQFLAALAAKIGAKPELFDDPETRLHRFRAQVFH